MQIAQLHNLSRSRRFCIITSLALGSVILIPSLSSAENENGKQPVDARKKCVSDLVKSCSDRECRSSEALNKLIKDLTEAAKSDDPDKMKKVLSQTSSSLEKLKSDHDKSAELMKTIHKRLQDLKQQIRLSKSEHEKASNLVEDEDMDDIIWAY